MVERSPWRRDAHRGSSPRSTQPANSKKNDQGAHEKAVLRQLVYGVTLGYLSQELSSLIEHRASGPSTQLGPVPRDNKVRVLHLKDKSDTDKRDSVFGCFGNKIQSRCQFLPMPVPRFKDRGSKRRGASVTRPPTRGTLHTVAPQASQQLYI